MKKRPLVFAVGFFTIGMLICAHGASLRMVFLAAAMFSGGILFWKNLNRRGIYILMAVFLLAGAVRMNLAESYRKEIAASYAGKEVYTPMIVTDFSDGGRVIVSFGDGSKKHRVYLQTEKELSLLPGEIIEGTITFREPSRSKVSPGDFAGYLGSRDVYLYAGDAQIRKTGRFEGGINGVMYSMRRFMDKQGQQHFSGTSRALFNAMVFGDGRLISPQLSTALQGSGLNHVAVVSGMHLSLIIMIQMFLTNKFLGKLRIKNLISVLGALIITVITGAGASVIRAFVMCVVFQLSQVFYRESDTLTSLGASALIMLMVNPYFVFNAGFVLSVLSVLGILLYNSKISAMLDTILPDGARDAISVTISAQLTVTPALIHYFGIITPYAIISNLLVFIFASVYVIAGLVFILFSKVPVICQLLVSGLNFMSDAVENICYSVTELPGAVLAAGKLDAWFLTGWTGVLILLYIYPCSRAKMRRTAAYVAAAVVVSCFLTGPKIDMTFSTYGRRSMTALFFDDGNTMLIDCPDKFDASILAENAGKEFRYGILTTAYTSGMLSAAQDGDMKVLIAPNRLFSDEDRRRLEENANKMGVRTLFLKEGEKRGLGNVWVEYLPLKIPAESGAAVKIEYDGKIFVSMQGLSSKDVSKLYDEKVSIPCDYLKIPFAVKEKDNSLQSLTHGKIIRNEKNLKVRINSR